MQYTSDILAQLDEAGLGDALNCNVPAEQKKRTVRKFRERNAK